MTLPEAVDLPIYRFPVWPSGEYANGIRVDHTTVYEIAVMPDNVSGVHTPFFDDHEDFDEPRGSHIARNRASAPDYATYARVDGKEVETRHGKIDLCHVTLNSGERIRDVIGTRQTIAALLRPRPCPDALATGVTVRVTTGAYVLHGECSGDRTLRPADGAVTLDPARLAGDEWMLVKAAGRNTAAFRFQIIVAATGATWTPQQWVPPAEPSGTGAWNDLSGTNSIQAQTRIRVKPQA